MRKKKRKSRIYMPRRAAGAVLTAFGVVFCASMGLSTWFVKETIRDEFHRIRHEMAEGIADSVLEESRSLIAAGEQPDGEWIQAASDHVISRYVGSQNTPYLLLSAALYDSSGNRVTESGERFVLYRSADVREAVGTGWDVNAYFTEEELNKLAVYAACDVETVQRESPSVSYQFYGESNPDGTDLDAFQVYETIWEQTDLTGQQDAQPVKTSCVWQWGTSAEMDMETAEGSLCFPGINLGVKNWERWRQNSFLREFPETMKSRCNSTGLTVYADEQELFQDIYPVRLAEGMTELSSQVYTLLIREEASPWMAAVDAMKYIYLGCGIFVLFCALIMLDVLERTYRKKELLEQKRRDFTNAVAHEMKTPLGVIRGFAENLAENPNSEKRTYYLEKIIDQTEWMDEIVKDMIQASRLDSGEFEAEREPVSVKDILEKETNRIRERADEKRLSLTMVWEGEPSLKGDRKLLEQAFRNLLDNAVCYSREEGKVSVILNRKCCRIENTGEKIPEEALERVCDMFYTGEKSRSTTGEKHLGMGLYLASRILDSHKIRLKLENTEDGVCVSMMFPDESVRCADGIGKV